jgi:hypothetical protein
MTYKMTEKIQNNDLKWPKMTKNDKKWLKI